MFLATVWSLFVSSLHAQSVGKQNGTDEWQTLFERRTFDGSAGEKLQYRLMSPGKVDPDTKYPIVLFLHGAGERGDDNQAQLVHGMREFATADRRQKFPCYVIAPQCPQNKKWVEVPWDADHHEQPDLPSDSLRLTHELIERLSKELPIDTDRIYITGLSMGGFGTFDAIARWPDFFAAAAPICGGGDSTAEIVARYRHVPIWVFHGDRDLVVSPQRSRDMVEALKKAGGKPKYSELMDTGHDSWNAAYSNNELFVWMFAEFRRSGR